MNIISYISIMSMTINCAIWLVPSIALLLEAVPGHGAPGGEWSRQDQPRGLNHVGTSSGSGTSARSHRGPHKAELRKAVLLPCGPRPGRQAGALLFAAGSLLVLFWKYYVGVVDKEVANSYIISESLCHRSRL
jgi:hypothetical protein